MITVRYWAGAMRAAGTEEEQFAVTSLAALQAVLAARPELTKIVAVASFLVDGQRAGADVELPDGARVDVLPPFAGG